MTARELEPFEDGGADYRPMPVVVQGGYETPGWLRLLPYPDEEWSVRSWRSWFNVLALPFRALSLGVLMLTHSLFTLLFVSASVVTIVIVYIARP